MTISKTPPADVTPLLPERAHARSVQEGGKDKLFSDSTSGSADFHFDDKTAAVFDDMISRSVPFYNEIERMTCELAADFATEGSQLFDLGCSTGTTLIQLDKSVHPSVRFVGVDNSAAMLEKARDKLQHAGVKRSCELLCVDLHSDHVVQNASVAVMILTLQFIRPLYRERALRGIYQGLNDQGCLILVEKQTMGDSLLNRLFIRYYYDMKRRHGYSEVEISQKREALENVLIPYRPQENREMLREVGFRYVEEFFRWYNFAGVIAAK